MKTYVLYHANCFDGFGAAWAAKKYFDEVGTTDVAYIPVAYGTNLPDIDDDSMVYIVDFSYPRDVLVKLRKRSRVLIVLDHHKTAEKDLEGLKFAHFDMNKSGALLTWEYFHNAPAPELIQHISDRDLWHFKLVGTQEVHAYLKSYNFDFDTWDRIERALDEDPYKIRAHGASILEYAARQVSRICDMAMMQVVEGHHVPVVNATSDWSEVGAELLKRYPNVPFVMSYWDNQYGKRQLSLRSRKDFDVSEIAKALGGSGHAQAAGVVIEAADWYGAF